MMSISARLPRLLYLPLCLLIPRTLSQDCPESQDNTEYLSFRSRPDLHPPVLNVTNSEPGVTPGYIFMAPYRLTSRVPGQNTALIYDNNGDLIWSGFGATGDGDAHDFHLCTYDDEDHLCMYEGQRRRGFARGHVSIFDDSLALVKQVRTQNGLANADQHESHLSRNGRAVFVTIYQPEVYDLSAQNITSGQGWVQNSVFQRVNINTGRLEFQWSAIEHVALSDGYVLPNSTEVAGDGLGAESAWDYFHMNSIDENEDGDYLISARHTNTLYKISGQCGRILWRLGGRQSDFTLQAGLNFSSQHDARWIFSNETTDIISLFDNASNGFQSTSALSSGMVLGIDHQTNTCSLLRSFPSPRDPNDDSVGRSSSQGNIRLFDSENWQTSHAFANWGNRPYVTEHDSLGNIIYQANIIGGFACGPMNYRAYKTNFTSEPRENPALYTYARTSNDSTVFFMSWNGATKVRSWRVYGKQQQCDDDWMVLAFIIKTGFETRFQASGYFDLGLVEALDGDGLGLRNSSLSGIRTFVPSSLLAQSCDEYGCDTAQSYNPAEQQVTVAETRPGCPVGEEGYGQPVVDNMSDDRRGNGSATMNDGNRTVDLSLKIVVSKYWGWALLILGIWSVIV